MKRVFIVNPVSGEGKGQIAGDIIEKYLQDKNIKDYKIIYTTKSCEATEIAKQYKDQNIIIYSVGGDGTLNEVINGMIDSKAKLQIVPVGTGNDFYKSILNKKLEFCDLGKVNDRYFINIVSFGLDAAVAKEANNLKQKKYPNKLVYYLSLVKNYFLFKGIKVTVDDQELLATIIAVCNGGYYGGGFSIAPGAKIDDGVFDIYQVNKLNRIKLLKLLTKLIKGTHGNDVAVNFSRKDKITISSPEPIICNIDGEIIEDNRFNIQICHKALNLACDDDLEIVKLLRKRKVFK